MSSHFPILQVLLPLVVAPLCLILRRPNHCWWLAFIANLAAVYVAASLLAQALQQDTIIYYLGGWAAPWGIEYRIDSLNAFLLLIISGISVVTLWFSRSQIETEIPPSRVYVFYTAWLLCLCGLLGMCATGDIFNVFVFLEIASLSMYLLISMGQERRALVAAFYYLVLGTIGATCFIIGIALLYALTGTLNIADIASRLTDVSNTTTVATAFVFIMLGIGIKAAVFPLHWWLPNAYSYAPSAVTALLAGTATKVSIYLLIRFSFDLFGFELSFNTFSFSEFLLVSGILATLIMSALAIFQDNVKKLLAFSSVAQIGYMSIGIGLFSTLGLTATLLHLFNHALMKAALFMALGAAFVRTGGYSLQHIQGLGRYAPWTMAAIVLGGFSLIGIPLTVGFISKWYLILAAMEQQQLWLAILIVISSLMAMVYVWKIVEAGYFKSATAPPENQREVELSLLIPLWILILANLYFGIDTSLSVGTANQAAQDLFGVSR